MRVGFFHTLFGPLLFGVFASGAPAAAVPVRPSTPPAVAAVAAAATGPANDNFANAATLSGTSPLVVTATTLGATTEPGEPYGGYRTLWYKWTAPAAVTVSVDTTGSTVSTVLSVRRPYTSPADYYHLSTLTQGTGYVDQYNNQQPVLSFKAVAGQVYYFTVGDISKAGGPVTLRVALPPANDNFANAAAFTTGGRNDNTISGSTAGATTEYGEPAGNGYRTVWYKWTATTTARAEIDTHGSAISTYLTTWQAPTSKPLALANLIGLDRTYGYAFPNATFDPTLSGYGYFDGSTHFQAVAGRTYYFSVGTYYSETGNFTLHLVTSPPANDNFASAASLAASGTQTVYGDNQDATGEPGESSAYNGTKASVWWKWQPSAGGTVEAIDTEGSQVNTVLEVFTGSSLATLTRLRHSDDVNAVNANYHPDADYSSRVAFPVTAGTTYYIRVAGIYSGNNYTPNRPDGEGPITLNLHNYPSPSTAADHLVWGRAYLEDASANGLAQADAQFAQALSADPNNAAANVLQGLTKIALLKQGQAYSDLLTQLGATNNTPNPLRLNFAYPKDARGVPIPTQTANTSQLITYLQQQLVPLLSVVDPLLGKVTDPTFKLLLTDSENSHRAATVDYADIQLLRASLQSIRVASYFTQTYNLVASLSTISNQARSRTLDVHNLKKTFGSLLKFNGDDHRGDMSNAFRLANSYYQLGSAAVRQRANPIDRRYLFQLPASQHKEVNFSTDLQNTSASLGGEIKWDGKDRINLSKLITTSTSLHDLLANFQGNQVIANTVPDPTFVGSVPDGTQAQVNGVLREHHLLYDLSTYAAWAAQLLPGSSPAQQGPDGNPAGDGYNNTFKFAFGLDPSRPSTPDEFLVQNLVRDAGTNQEYLTITFAQRIDTTAVSYVVALSNDLKTWDRTQTQVEQVGTPVPNDDGITESVTVRAKTSTSILAKQFLRVEAVVNLP